MQVIFAIVCLGIFFFATLGASFMDTSSWLKAAIIIPAVFLVIYSLARIQPREASTDGQTGK